IADHHSEVAALRLVTSRWSGRCLIRCRSDLIEVRDRPQNFAAMPQQNTEILEILLCQIADDREVNSVVREALGVLGQAELFEPVRDLLHRDYASFRVGLSTFSLPESGTTSTPQLGIARRACPSARCPFQSFGDVGSISVCPKADVAGRTEVALF